MTRGYPATFTRTVQAIGPSGPTSAVQSAAIDTLGFEVAKIVAAHGAYTSGDRQAVVTVEESADGSTGWTAISGAAFAAVSDASDEKIDLGTVRIRGRERYFRIAVAVTGSTGLPVLGVLVELMGPNRPEDYATDTYAFEVGVPA